MEPRSLIVVALCVVSAEPLSDTLEALRPLEESLKSRSDAFTTYANEFTQEYEPVAYAAIPLHHPMPVIAILSDNPLTPAPPKLFGQHVFASSAKQPAYAKPEYQNYVPTEFNPETEYQRLMEYQKPYALEYQKPSPAEYQKPFPAEYQKPYVEYQKPYQMEYQKPYEYPQFPPLEYAKPYNVNYKYHPSEYAKPYASEAYRPYASEYVKHYASDYVKPHASGEAPTILYARPTKDGGYTYHRRPLRNRNAKRPRKTKPMIIRVHKYRTIRSRSSGY